MSNCNLTTCRYNAGRKCTNEEKREECVDVSRKGCVKMLIVALQDDVDWLYAIWNTVTDRFIGVNPGYNECIGIVMDYNDWSYEVAKSRVDHPQPFSDIAKQIEL